jgi:hypothetical protein
MEALRASAGDYLRSDDRCEDISEPLEQQNSHNMYQLDFAFNRGRSQRRFWRWGSGDGKQRVSGRKLLGKDQLLAQLCFVTDE